MSIYTAERICRALERLEDAPILPILGGLGVVVLIIARLAA